MAIKRICQTCGYIDIKQSGPALLDETGKEVYDIEYITLDECLRCCGVVEDKKKEVPSKEKNTKEDKADDKDVKVKREATGGKKEGNKEIKGIQTPTEEASNPKTQGSTSTGKPSTAKSNGKKSGSDGDGSKGDKGSGKRNKVTSKGST